MKTIKRARPALIATVLLAAAGAAPAMAADLPGTAVVHPVAPAATMKVQKATKPAAAKNRVARAAPRLTQPLPAPIRVASRVLSPGGDCYLSRTCGGRFVLIMGIVY